MYKIASTALAALLAATMAIPAPASAASVNLSIGQQGNYVSQQCLAHPNWRGCDDWKVNRKHWGQNDYRRWYQWNWPHLGSIAAGLFGFAVGAAVLNGIAQANDNRGNGYDDHVNACEDAYRSYSAETDMYRGFDGRLHRCTL